MKTPTQIIDYHLSVTREWPDDVDVDAMDWGPVLDALEDRPDVVETYSHSVAADRRDGHITQRTNVFIRTESPDGLTAREIARSVGVTLMSVDHAARVKERGWRRHTTSDAPFLHDSAQQMLENNRR